MPFTNQNLYVMKFAESQNGKLYFENEGGFPVLYVPKGGYLENATVAGARWFPLGENFHPADPVFLGIAPSYTEFVTSAGTRIPVSTAAITAIRRLFPAAYSCRQSGCSSRLAGIRTTAGTGYHHYYRDHPASTVWGITTAISTTLPETTTGHLPRTGISAARRWLQPRWLQPHGGFAGQSGYGSLTAHIPRHRRLWRRVATATM